MPGGSRRGCGRKAIEIDLGELEKLCALQCTDQEIAAWFGISPHTIERRRKRAEFREVMERGKAKGRVSLRRSLWRLANAGNAAANIFLAKNLLGYRDVVNNEPDENLLAGVQIRFINSPEETAQAEAERLHSPRPGDRPDQNVH